MEHYGLVPYRALCVLLKKFSLRVLRTFICVLIDRDVYIYIYIYWVYIYICVDIDKDIYTYMYMCIYIYGDREGPVMTTMVSAVMD